MEHREGTTKVCSGAQTKKVHNADLFSALQETKIKATSRDSLRLYSSLMTSVLAMSHFQDMFHSGMTGSKVSIIFSLHTVGAMVMSPGAAILSDRFGRRVAMFCGEWVIIIGMVVAATSGQLEVLMISVFGQFSGNGLGYFNTVIFANLGVTAVAQQLGYNLLNAVLSALGAVATVAVTDRTPRRRVLVVGTLVCAAALARNAGLSAVLAHQPQNIAPSYARAALARYLLFNIVSSFTYTPLQAVIPAEALETTTRANGLALSNVLVNAVGFINQFCGPITLGNIGYRYIYIFVGWDLVEALLWYLFGVESLGRTLEQLAWVYEQPNPVKASLRVDNVAVQDNGKVTETAVFPTAEKR
ncbi:major facilitator superfamily transporter lactose [Grosmannia clavigera kw1407]|uniref:Major facilitator superfamily transporter lactose n=1 Tax=Grosmannia clavigera (strain kw1407 / UAMH 11150) TaxID=655863 RepID=F0XPJ3_GROCL|nr:major facilitator superfamily transporter lactose [Grosmannia clavigera kw1407]EFX00295.1 major facilitator superfamily transporter lactose [Grosmannia clavigera kw1407]